MVKIYSVRDQYTGYGQPFTHQNDACAIRDFRLAVSRKDSVLFSSAKDYDLMRIGQFDDETGTIIPETPVIVASGISVAKEFVDA